MDYGIWPFTKEYIEAPKKYNLKKFKTVMEQKYINQFKNVASFKRLIDKMRAKNGFHAVWDDHDFAWNNVKGVNVNEDWNKYPSDLQRLCKLLEDKEKVLFLAGDVHYNKFVPVKYIKELDCTTPPQLISSWMHINLLGLGIKADNSTIGAF